MLKIALTGASGFVGSRVLERLSGFDTRIIGRTNAGQVPEGKFFVANIGPATDYAGFFEGVDVVIHCAARAHIMDDHTEAPLLAYRKVNTDGTMNLALQAAKAGVRRFIFISSVKVNGEVTEHGIPFGPKVTKPPEDSYGLSKYEAEKGLQELVKATEMDVVIIRPPLVYGPGVQANFLSLLKLAAKGIPLPLGSVIKNRRSLVYVDNLADLVVTCINHPNAANHVFLVSDGEDLSTADMLSRLAVAFGKSGTLLPFPESLIHVACQLLGKSAVYRRLCLSLQLDISETQQKLGWHPPYTVDEGFAKTAKSYLNAKV